MSKVVSYTLFGDKQMYLTGALRNAEQVPQAYPGWSSQFYVGRSVPVEIKQELIRTPHTNVILMPDPEDQTATFWRFGVGREVTAMMSRDVDSRIELREIAAVTEWLSSPFDWHIMRDHPWHNVPMLAGMFGCKNPEEIRRLSKWSKIYRGQDYYQTDQVFLRSYIYQFARFSLMAHDEFFHFEDDLVTQSRPFPTPRINGQFCCQAYDENEQLVHPEHQLGADFAYPTTTEVYRRPTVSNL